MLCLKQHMSEEPTEDDLDEEEFIESSSNNLSIKCLNSIVFALSCRLSIVHANLLKVVANQQAQAFGGFGEFKTTSAILHRVNSLTFSATLSVIM